jgi:hypothetical protein
LLDIIRHESAFHSCLDGHVIDEKHLEPKNPNTRIARDKWCDN